MKYLVRRVLIVGAVVGALLAVPASAQAATGRHCRGGDIYQSSRHNHGILNGTQIAVPIDLDFDVSHNALGLLGNAYSRGDDYNFCWYDNVRRHHRG